MPIIAQERVSFGSETIGDWDDFVITLNGGASVSY
jgi:hypothetical protein